MDAQCTPCRDVTRQHSDCGQQQRHTNECCGIGRLHFEQQAHHQPCKRECAGKPEHDTQQTELDSILLHQPQNIAMLRAQSHVDADFVRSLIHTIRNHAVDAHSGQRHRQRRKHPEQ